VRDGPRGLAWGLPLSAARPGPGAARLADLAAGDGAGSRRLVAAACAALPVLLLYDAAWGIGGALRPVQYPSSWRVVADRGYPPDQERGLGDLLVLPLSAYRAPTWNHGATVLDPLARYLPLDPVTGDTLVVSGRDVPGDDPRVDRVRVALALADPAARGRALLRAGITDVGVHTDSSPAATSVPDLNADVVVTTPDLVLLRLRGDATEQHPRTAAVVVLATAWLLFLLEPLLALVGAVRWGWPRRRRRGPPAATASV
jgi:hypothetical protein